MAVIAVLNPKSGVGMTTLAVNLAGAMIQRGFDILLVDSDPQGLSTDWAYARDNLSREVPDIASLPSLTSLRQLRSSKQKYDHVVIDGVAGRGKLSTGVIKVSDMILLPIRPTSMDVWALDPLVDVIQAHQQQIRAQYGGIKRVHCALCITQQIDGKSSVKHIEDMVAKRGLPLLSSRVQHRIEFAHAMQAGVTVQELAPESKAALEINALAGELLDFIETA